MTGRREIHNGADDNASGTVVLLEAARQLASLHHQKPLARRVCFIAFSAEELGLIGSKKYVQEPWFPIESTVAMLNLDMVGRLRNNHLTVYGVGTSPTWTLLLRPLAKEYQLGLQLREGATGRAIMRRSSSVACRCCISSRAFMPSTIDRATTPIC